MKYAGMPMGMWILFRRSFRNHLVSVLGFTETEAARVTTAAKPKYREIIAKLPEFEKCVCQRKSVAKGLPKSEHLSTPQ